MTHDEALHQLAHECPRKILGLLHGNGQHRHFTSERFPGKVLCIHKDSEVPGDCVPTAAQAYLWEEARADARGATG